jgi:hypothetical protein
MNIESKIPVVIRTAPIYPAVNYRIKIHDASAEVVDTIPSNVKWSRMQSFTFNPKNHHGPFYIEIMPENPAKN